MKKFVSAILLIVYIASLSSLSCLAKSSPTILPKAKAVKIAKQVVINDPKRQITNYNNPKVEMFIGEDNHKVSLFNDNKKISTTNLAKLKLWKITFSTKMDPLIGPIILYIDYYSGKVYGFDVRF